MTVHQSHPEIVKRLKRASGHLAKVIAMIEAGVPCADVAQQMHAVVKAVDSAKSAFVQDHIEHCLDDGLNGSRDEVRAKIRELKAVAKYL